MAALPVQARSSAPMSDGEAARHFWWPENLYRFPPVPFGQIRRVPPLGALLEIEVATEPAKHTEQAAIQAVIRRQAKIFATAVPAPFVPVIPPREKFLETFYHYCVTSLWNARQIELWRHRLSQPVTGLKGLPGLVGRALDPYFVTQQY